MFVFYCTICKRIQTTILAPICNRSPLGGRPSDIRCACHG